MVFIPNDILDEVLKQGVENEGTPDEYWEGQVLMIYAMFSQKEGKEPDAKRIADFHKFPLERVENSLNKFAEKGWLERVKDYSE